MGFAICGSQYNICKYRSLGKCQHVVHQLYTNISKPSFDLCIFICLARPRLLTNKKNNIEQNFSNLLCKLESEISYKSNHELHDKIKISNLLNDGTMCFKSSFYQPVQDLEERRQKDLSDLVTTPRYKDTSSNDVVSSSTFTLDQYLFLVKGMENDATQNIWLPPNGMVNAGETIKQATKRILNSYFNKSFNFFLYASAPIGYNLFSHMDEIKGQKVIRTYKELYFFAKYIDGLNEDITQYQWRTINNLKIYIPKHIYINLYKFV